jgi:hypothetical protein
VKVILAAAEEQLVSSDFNYNLKYILLYDVTDYYNASFAKIFCNFFLLFTGSADMPRSARERLWREMLY